MQPSKQANIDRFRAVERQVAAWLMSRGNSILPVYDYSGLGAAKAPLLQAFSYRDSLVVPDLLVARKGVMLWAEVKWKSAASLYRKNNTLDTGIERRLWLQYQRVKRLTGARVYLIFVQKAEGYLTCDEIGHLESFARVDASDAMARGGMMFWELSKLHRLAEYSDVIREAA